jgi:predicted phage tail protein
MSKTERRFVKVKLLGELGRKFGRSYEFMALNPKEIISALSNQLDGFKEYLANAHTNGIFFKLVTTTPEGIDYNECMMSCDDLVIAPVITGAGGSGGSTLGKILIGVALIGLAFVPGIGTAIIANTTATGMITGGSILFSLGAALVLGGIADLLTPTPKKPKDNETQSSYLFDRAAELTTQGMPIPLLYGEFLTTSPLVVSSAISTEAAFV